MEVKTYTIDEIKNIVTPIAEKYQIALYSIHIQVA